MRRQLMVDQTQWYRLQLSRAVALAGQVTDGVSGKPIAGAVVEIVDRPERTVSRPDGIFFFLDLPADSYRLRVIAPQLGTRYGTVETDAVQVEDGRDAAGRVKVAKADVKLPPTRIHGQVTRSDNAQPIVGAKVRLRGDTTVVRTDADGRYALTGLVAGNPTLEVSAANFVTASQAVELGAGQDLTVDIALQPQPE